MARTRFILSYLKSRYDIKKMKFFLKKDVYYVVVSNEEECDEKIEF